MPRPEPAAFERLVTEQHAAVFRSARRLCADDGAAADVTQDVFVRVWQGKVRLDRAESVRATLCWFAAHLARNKNRAARRRAQHEENAMSARTAATHTTDPARVSAANDLNRDLAGMLAELPDTLRLPFLMRHQDELSLAAIGTALRLPTSTVHDRIEAALARLRGLLQQRGHAVGAAALPAMVSRLEAPPLPTGLVARLMAVGTAAPVVAGTSKGLLVALAGAVLVVAAVVASTSLGSQPVDHPPAVTALASGAGGNTIQDPPGNSGPATERRAAGAAAGASASPPPPPAALRTNATFTGTVRDAEAWPVVGAKVQVVAGGGYKSFPLGEAATTDARGVFTVAGRSDWLDARAVRLCVIENGRQLLLTGDITLPRPADAPPLELVLPASVGSATSRYDLTVEVRDEAGAPLAGVEVALYAATEPRPRPEWASAEGQVTSGVDGRARLEGRGLGTKWLFVDGRPLQRQSVFTAVTLAKAGIHDTVATLSPGRELAVAVTTVSGRELEWGEPWLDDERTGLRHQGRRAGDRWRFGGLGDGPYTVSASGDGRCSLASIPGVLATRESITLTLKDRDDERDVGDHLAELHGELIDAATGAVVEFAGFEVDVKPFLADGSSLVFDGVQPPRPVQTMVTDTRFAKFHEVGLAAGKWVLVVAVPGYALAGRVFELREREVRTGLRIELHRPGVVRGRVVDGNGKPCPGVSLFALGNGPLADRHVAAWQQYSARESGPGDAAPSYAPIAGWSRADGTFVVDRIPPGMPLRLVAHHDAHGFVVVPLAPLRAGEEVAGFELRLQPR